MFKHNCNKENHKYEARYDERPMASLEGFKYKGCEDMNEIRQLFIFKTYVHDICVRCGNIVMRNSGGRRHGQLRQL